MAAGLATTLIQLSIKDQVEEGLAMPLDQRPSWRLWKKPLVRPGLLKEHLRIHRRMYPQSRLRLRLWISLAIQAGGMLGAVLWVVRAR
jgi:hypothetical protein